MSRDLDKFYTKESIVIKLLNVIKKKINIKTCDLIIEPSAGNGVFLNNLIEIYKYDDKIIHFIGNPPFGSQSSLAKQFIKKCILMNANTISFILAKSFKKDSVKKIFPLNYSLLYQIDIKDDAFLLDGNNYSVPCVFQIWCKNTKLRKPVKILVSKNFVFCKKNDNPTYSIRRIGWYAGKISRDINKSENSHYFIKLNKNINRKNFYNSYVKKIFFLHNDTVGPRSISKNELIKKTNFI
jgi:hypothetical protein